MIEFTIETNILYEVFKTVKPFAGKDNRNPVLSGICCNVYAKKMRCAALDGAYLFDGVFPIVAAKGEGRFILPVINGFEKSKDAYSMTRVTVDNKTIKIENEGGSITVEKINEGYPNWEKFFPYKPAESRIFMNPARLKKALACFPKGETVEIEYRGETQPLIIRGREARTLVLPLNPISAKKKELYNGMVD